jgi:hypothetical protein
MVFFDEAEQALFVEKQAEQAGCLQCVEQGDKYRDQQQSQENRFFIGLLHVMGVGTQGMARRNFLSARAGG